jgi:hypothetical protein
LLDKSVLIYLSAISALWAVRPLITDLRGCVGRVNIKEIEGIGN